MYSRASEAIAAGEHRSVVVGYEFDYESWSDREKTASAWAWKREFYTGFTSLLSRRLWDARRRATVEVQEQLALDGEGGTGVEIVLREKDLEVDEFFRRRNPHLYPPDEEGNIPTESKSRGRQWRDKGAKGTDYIPEAQRAGRAAAATMDLGLGTGVGAADRRAVEG